jgi:hypothetical protein
MSTLYLFAFWTLRKAQCGICVFNCELRSNILSIYILQYTQYSIHGSSKKVVGYYNQVIILEILKKEKTNISNTSELSSKSFYFNVKRFFGRIPTSIIKVIYNFLIMNRHLFLKSY